MPLPSTHVAIVHLAGRRGSLPGRLYAILPATPSRRRRDSVTPLARRGPKRPLCRRQLRTPAADGIMAMYKSGRPQSGRPIPKRDY